MKQATKVLISINNLRPFTECLFTKYTFIKRIQMSHFPEQKKETVFTK